MVSSERYNHLNELYTALLDSCTQTPRMFSSIVIECSMMGLFYGVLQPFIVVVKSLIPLKGLGIAKSRRDRS